MSKIHYRVLRSSVVLAKHSAAFREMSLDVREAIEAVVRVNYQFDQIPNILLERVFAAFDDDFTARVRNEYTFYPDSGNVRIHDRACAVCDLCGKGDSKESGDNKDHLRIEYRLTNTAGGEDKWCGATCIKNYGLRVDGASTAEEAARLLDQAMRQAMRLYVVNQWRNDNPDHAKIPADYQDLRRALHILHSIGYTERVLLGVADECAAITSSRGPLRAFKAAANFYLREGYLTPKKQPAWDNARRTIRFASAVETAVSATAAMSQNDTITKLFHTNIEVP